MASKTTTIVIDDLTGAAGADTVKFGLDGEWFEIDLTEDNAARLRAKLGEFAQHARKLGGKATRTRTIKSPTWRGPKRTAELAVVREWAKGAGFRVADRGRVPANVLDAYARSQAAPAVPAAVFSGHDR